MIKDSELKLKYVGGASFVNHEPVFSKDAQFIFIACSNRLYSYTTKTGKRFIQYKGLEEDIASYGVYMHEGTEYLAACTVAGNVICWKVANGLKMKQTNIPHDNVKCFKIFENSTGKYKVFVAWQNGTFLNCGLMNIAESFKFQTLSLNLNYRNSCKIDFGGQGEHSFMSMIHGKKMYIVNLMDTENIIKVKLASRKFTCLACHPESEVILTGDDSGRVVLWQNLFAGYVQAVFHWHTLPVNTVCFSSSGTSFYSGGSECVLVKWTAEDSHQKKFLPRLPNYIQHLAIAPENLYLAIASKDNAVHIIDMQFSHVSIIQELILGDEFPAGIHLDPKSRGLVMNGTVGHLQFYLPHNMQLLYNLDVVGMNRITNERDTIMENTDIKAVAISKNGLWMATIEERSDNGDFLESRLKFWNFNVAKQSFQLNTNVEYAHERKVIDLKFQPSNKEDLRLVTIGEDGNFKVWQLVDATTVYTKGSAWRCASSGFYRNLTPTSLAFSYDGSLLAVAFENILTTWLPDTCAIKCSLLHPTYQEPIKQIAFGTNTQCHLIVVATKRRLSVWNLLTLSMIWTVPLKVAHLISDTLTTYMGVITRNNKLFVFEPSSADPLYVHDALVDEDKSVLAAAFVPNGSVKDNYRNWYNKSQLFIIDSNKELYCLDSSGSSSDALEPMQFMLNETQSMFGLMTPGHKTTSVQTHNVVHNFTQKAATRKTLDDLLDTPIHTMVPMRMIAHSIISSLIYEKKQQDAAADNDDEHTESRGTVTATNTNGVDVGQLVDDLSKIALEQSNWTTILTT